jgi:hypothetical protein
MPLIGKVMENQNFRYFHLQTKILCLQTYLVKNESVCINSRKKAKKGSLVGLALSS